MAIVAGKSSKRHEHQKGSDAVWIALSLAAMALFALFLLLIIPPGRAGVDSSVVLFYSVFAGGWLLDLAYLALLGGQFHISTAAVKWVVCAAAASFLGNLCLLMAMRRAPNPGYPIAIESSKALVVTLVSVWLFAAELSLLKGLAALCCVVGVALICL